MKTDIYTPDRRKSPRKAEYIRGQCLENAGLIIPHGAIAIVDCSITPKVGDLVHCDNYLGTCQGFIKQIKELRDDFVIVGTSYVDESRDFTFEAYTIYGVITEAFDKLSGKRVYCRDEANQNKYTEEKKDENQN